MLQQTSPHVCGGTFCGANEDTDTEYKEKIKNLETETDQNRMGIITREIYAHLIYLLEVYFAHQFIQTNFCCVKVKRAASASIPDAHTRYMCLN